MSNLIINVIAIALTAVAALMGVYFGGAAYMDGLAKAKANEIRNVFEQVSTALYLVQNDTGSRINVTTTNLVTLVPKYMSSLPAPGIASYYGGVPIMYANGGIVNAVLMLETNNVRVCKQIEAMRTGTVPTTIRGVTHNMNTEFAGKFGCFYDPGNWGVSNYIAYYTPYGTPIP